MELDAAVAYACRHWKKSEVSDPFFLYSLLSDLCHSDYDDKMSINFLYAFDSRYRIIQTLLKYGGNGREKLMKEFRSQEKQITVGDNRFDIIEEDFTKLILIFIEVMDIA